jgi:glycosyltransferase involved in cell wall biosynthesis
MKTILHIIPSLGDGGAEAVLFRLCQGDYINKHIVVSMTNDGKYGELLFDIGVEVYSLNISTRPIQFISAITRLFKIIKNKDIDVVQTWMYHADLLGGILARLSGKKVCWGVHNTTLVYGKSKLLTIIIAKSSALLSRIIPSAIIYCAHASKKVHEKMGYSKHNGSVIPNGYDLTVFSPNESVRSDLKKKLGLEGFDIIGNVGRFDPQKDHSNLLEALSLVRNEYSGFKCILIGGGLSKDNNVLMSDIRRLKLEEQVVLFGQSSEVQKMMNVMDLHVLASAYGEAFPNVIAEAMASGVPCIATDVGDSSYMVGQTGWVVPPKNPVELSKSILIALSQLHSCDSWAVRCGNARSRVEENFSLENMISKYNTIWNAC